MFQGNRFTYVWFGTLATVILAVLINSMFLDSEMLMAYGFVGVMAVPVLYLALDKEGVSSDPLRNGDSVPWDNPWATMSITAILIGVGALAAAPVLEWQASEVTWYLVSGSILGAIIDFAINEFKRSQRMPGNLY